MKYLSIDIEATGLNSDCLMIEFAMIPFCTQTSTLETQLKDHCYLQCPPFETLRPTLDPWIIQHNKGLIEKAHSEGISLPQFKKRLENYFNSSDVKSYFSNSPIVLFGKSMNALDLPFLHRDLGQEFMRKYFNHKVNDLTAFAYGLMDMGLLPPETAGSTSLMKYLGMGEVAHNALDDARNTALAYLNLLQKFKALIKN